MYSCKQEVRVEMRIDYITINDQELDFELDSDVLGDIQINITSGPDKILDALYVDDIVEYLTKNGYVVEKSE